MISLRIARLRRLAAAASLCLAAAAGAAEQAPRPAVFGEEIGKQEKIYKSKGADTPEGYVIDRSLLTYAFAFSQTFKRSLAQLQPQDRWLDIGAGEARAVTDYAMSEHESLYKAFGPLNPKKAQVVAMSIEDRRTHEWHEAAATLGPGRMEYLVGRPLGEYSLAELGKYRLVTDLMGGFSYTTRLSRYMEMTLALLEVDGDFYATLADVHSESSDNKPHYADSPYLTEIVSASGAEVKMCAWLKQISCVQVACQFRSDWTPPIEVYHVRKTCEQVKVPALDIVHFQAGTPPERRFRLADPPPAGASASALPVADTQAASNP
jgi:hypothetical protein